MIYLKSPRDIKRMRRAGKVLAAAFVELFDKVRPGVATSDIDRAMEDAIRRAGARPAFKGYRGGNRTPFPAATCISVESEVVHGLPSQRELEEGQIVGIDAGLELDGWFADMAASFLVGKVDETRRSLWQVTREALYRGIDKARPGNRVVDIGVAVQDWVEQHSFNVIRDLVGHGIGSGLHEEPAVPNYRSSDSNIPLKPGMTLAIEPMVSVGGWQIKVLKDGWTATTADGSPAGHFEHTILVTEGEPEILTLLEDGSDPWLAVAE